MGAPLGDAFIAFLKVLFFMLIVGGIALLAGGIALLAGLAKAYGVRKAAGIVGGVAGALFFIPILYTYFSAAYGDFSRNREFRAKQRKLEKAKTTLIRAVDKLDEEKVIKLLKKKADPNETADGRSPLTAAIYHGRKSHDEEVFEKSDRIIEFLLDGGADPSMCVPQPKKVPDYIRFGMPNDYEVVKWSRGEPLPRPVQAAIECNRPNALAILIDHGAEINKQDDFYPVQYALDEFRFDCLEILLANGALSSVWHSEKKNMTLIMKFMAKDESDERREQFSRILKYLAKYDGDMNRRDLDGDTAIHYYAKRSSDYEIDSRIKQLVGYGADINAVNNYGKTALMCAVISKYSMKLIYAGVLTLVEAGADITVKDKDGKTALDFFMEHRGSEKEKKYLDEEDAELRKKIIALLTPKLAMTAKTQIASIKMTSTEISKSSIPLDSSKNLPKAPEVFEPEVKAETAKDESFVQGGHLELMDMKDDW